MKDKEGKTVNNSKRTPRHGGQAHMINTKMAEFMLETASLLNEQNNMNEYEPTKKTDDDFVPDMVEWKQHLTDLISDSKKGYFSND